MATYSSKKYPAGSVTSAQLADGTVVAVDLADGAITSAKLNSTVDLSGKTVTYRSIVAGDIASNAITTAKINDAAVSHTKMANSGAELGMRNRLINGNFNFWQRGTSRTILSSGTPYLADRWCGAVGYQNGAHQRSAISSPPTGLSSQYAMRVSSFTTSEAAGGSRLDCGQKIESINCYDLSGKTITVSFWMRASAATWTSVSNTTDSAFNNFGCRVQYNTTTTDTAISTDTGDGSTTVTAVSGTNATNGTTQLTIANGSLPTTFTKYTFTSTVPANTKNLTVRFASSNLGSTASAGTVWYEVADVQLEEGSTATPFELRQYGTELALCQRYFNIYRGGTYGNFQIYGSVFAFGISVPEPMRVQPTFVTNITDANFAGAASPNSNQWAMYVQNSGWNVYSGSINTLSLNGASENSTNYSLGTYGCTLGSGFTGFLLGSNLYFSFNAEL
jgi:hypothetical protein